MDAKQSVAALGALAQESRLEVFRLLVRRGPAGIPAGEISRRRLRVSADMASISACGSLNSSARMFDRAFSRLVVIGIATTPC